MLERETQSELNESGIDCRCRYNAEIRAVGLDDRAAHTRRHRELSVIEDVEKFRAELQRLALGDPRDLGRREVEVILVRAAGDAHAGVAEVG